MMKTFFTTSVLLVMFALGLALAGCNGGATDTHDNEGDAHAGHDDGSAAHDHPTSGPHGGHLFEIGDHEYHAELTHDESTGKATVYLLDSDIQNPVKADDESLEIQVFHEDEYASYTLGATDEEGEYHLDDACLAETLAHAEELKGRLKVSIGGKPFTIAISHHAHDDAEHNHD